MNGCGHNFYAHCPKITILLGRLNGKFDLQKDRVENSELNLGYIKYRLFDYKRKIICHWVSFPSPSANLGHRLLNLAALCVKT